MKYFLNFNARTSDILKIKKENALVKVEHAFLFL